MLHHSVLAFPRVPAATSVSTVRTTTTATVAVTTVAIATTSVYTSTTTGTTMTFMAASTILSATVTTNSSTPTLFTNLQRRDTQRHTAAVEARGVSIPTKFVALFKYMFASS